MGSRRRGAIKAHILDGQALQQASITEPKSLTTKSRSLIMYGSILLLLVGYILSTFSSSFPSLGGTGAYCDHRYRSKDANSAIDRAKSDSCRKQLMQIACQNPSELYPASLPSFCDVKNQDVADAHLGCYKDSFDERLLEGGMVRFRESNSAATCVNHCASLGYRFAGAQYAIECFCGNTKPPDSFRVGDSLCDRNCPNQPSRQCGGYLTMNVYNVGQFPPPSNGESDENTREVRVAFLFVVHGRALRQVLRHFKLMYNPVDYFYFHVDSRSSYLYRNVKTLEARYPSNVFVTEKRWPTIWGGVSLLQMMLSSMREMLDLNWEMDFVLNLSESDYLLKRPTDLKEYLSANRGKNFLKSHGRDASTFVKKQGLDRTFHECDNHMFRLGHRSLPSGIQLDGGSDWVCLSRDFVVYLLDERDELLDGLYSIFNYTLLPAESFFHTALKNSRFCQSYVNNNLRITNWKRQFGCQCQHKAVVDWCGCSPNVFLPSDWNKILNTQKRQVFFARKFESALSFDVLNKIDEWVFGANVTNDDVDDDYYWENIFHHIDDSEDNNYKPVVALSETIAQSCAGKLLNTTIAIFVKEVTALYSRSGFSDVLIKFSAAMDTYECKIRPRGALSKHSIYGLNVNTHYDVKERVFRNPLGAIGSLSKPQLLIEVSDDYVPHQGSVLWYDPFGEVVRINRDVSINVTTKVHLVNLKIETALQTGVWTTVYLPNGDYGEAVQTQFLIIPVHTEDDIPAVQTPMQEEMSEMELRLTEAIKMNKHDQRHSSRSGITEWVKRAYRYEDLCHISKKLSHFPACHKTPWSSSFPDPKSTREL
jgi:protein xylosyltransferase